MYGTQDGPSLGRHVFEGDDDVLSHEGVQTGSGLVQEH